MHKLLNNSRFIYLNFEVVCCFRGEIPHRGIDTIIKDPLNDPFLVRKCGVSCVEHQITLIQYTKWLQYPVAVLIR